MQHPPHPPRWMLRLFRWFCHPDYVEDIEGDLLERYARKALKKSSRQAKRYFLGEVISLFRLNLIRTLHSDSSLINIGMFRHNLLISFRSFFRHKATFLINLIGLSTGLATAFFIFLWAQDEWRMDRFHEQGDQLYQVLQHYRKPNSVDVKPWTPRPLAPALKTEIPDIALASSFKIDSYYKGVLTAGETSSRAQPAFAGPDFPKIFTFPMLHGDASGALRQPGSVLLSADLARKLFKTPDRAMGQSISWNKTAGELERFKGEFIVAGVFADIPAYSSLQFDLMLPISFFGEHAWGSELWTNHPVSTALVLQAEADPVEVSEKITQLCRERAGNDRDLYELVPFANQYLYGTYENGVQAGGRIDYLRLFVVIAFLIILIASINFMNLSTARASLRLKEIGVKKSFGVHRRQLINQFMTESLLMTSLAFGLAIVLVFSLIG
ncbi:MAG: ABC transporter permease, partial [Bacteroidota bacterium]